MEHLECWWRMITRSCEGIGTILEEQPGWEVEVGLRRRETWTRRAPEKPHIHRGDVSMPGLNGLERHGNVAVKTLDGKC